MEREAWHHLRVTARTEAFGAELGLEVAVVFFAGQVVYGLLAAATS